MFGSSVISILFSKSVASSLYTKPSGAGCLFLVLLCLLRPGRLDSMPLLAG